MVVYKPKNKTSSNVEQENTIINNCKCDNHNHHEHHNDHCPCPPRPCPQEAEITIEVDGSAEVNMDVLYGPPGKDGKINGYNEVEIVGGKNIEVISKGDNECHNNEIIINSTTFINDIDAEPCCDCEECTCFEQAKPNSCWKIIHNLNKYPSVTVVNEYGTEIICEVQYISENEVHLRFNGKFRGKAYLN